MVGDELRDHGSVDEGASTSAPSNHAGSHERTGDVTQIDLSASDRSGLVDALSTLSSIPGIAFVSLGLRDIVRHRLVQDIVQAYDSCPDSAGDIQSAETETVPVDAPVVQTQLGGDRQGKDSSQCDSADGGVEP